MDIKKIKDSVAAELEVFRQEVEAHLVKHPMGVDYFGMKAAKNPRLVRRLREGQGVQLDTIVSVRAFMASREAVLVAGSAQ